MTTPNIISSQGRIKQVIVTAKPSRGIITVEEGPKKTNPPVRNPTFREHEGLKALQRELHEQDKNQK